MNKIILSLLIMASPLFAGNEGSGGGVIMDFNPVNDFGTALPGSLGGIGHDPGAILNINGLQGSLHVPTPALIGRSKLLKVSDRDFGELIDAYHHNESVFSYDIQQELVPFSISVDRELINARSSSGETYSIIQLD